MTVKNIIFPINWKDNPKIKKANKDVFVTLEDDYIYMVRLATVKNIEYLIKKEKMNYIEPGHLFVIVKELTKEIIEEAITVYTEKNNGYWLKFYQFAGNIDKSVFDKLQAKHIQYLKELNELNNSQII